MTIRKTAQAISKKHEQATDEGHCLPSRAGQTRLRGSHGRPWVAAAPQAPPLLQRLRESRLQRQSEEPENRATRAPAPLATLHASAWQTRPLTRAHRSCRCRCSSGSDPVRSSILQHQSQQGRSPTSWRARVSRPRVARPAATRPDPARGACRCERARPVNEPSEKPAAPDGNNTSSKRPAILGWHNQTHLLLQLQ
jgi:hypothetical protein